MDDRFLFCLVEVQKSNFKIIGFLILPSPKIMSKRRRQNHNNVFFLNLFANMHRKQT